MSVARQSSPTELEQAPRPAFVKRIDSPERSVGFGDGRLDLISLGGRPLGRGSFPPGWKWTPGPGLAGVRFTGVVLSGRAKVQTRQGESADLAPGDFFSIAAEDDCWVVGVRPCEILYVDGLERLMDRTPG